MAFALGPAVHEQFLFKALRSTNSSYLALNPKPGLFGSLSFGQDVRRGMADQMEDSCFGVASLGV